MPASPEFSQANNPAVPAVRFAVPRGDNVLLVGTGTDKDAGLTREDKLRSAGKRLLGTALSPNFGWHQDGRSNYVADPVDDLGHRQSALARLLYEQAWMPGLDDDTDAIIYDLDQPAVDIVHLRPPQTCDE